MSGQDLEWLGWEKENLAEGCSVTSPVLSSHTKYLPCCNLTWVEDKPQDQQNEKLGKVPVVVSGIFQKSRPLVAERHSLPIVAPWKLRKSA